jgi:hypothetical protein
VGWRAGRAQCKINIITRGLTFREFFAGQMPELSSYGWLSFRGRVNGALPRIMTWLSIGMAARSRFFEGS